jgi:hypothetical protein
VPVRKKTSAETLPLRITVVDPPPNILWALQAFGFAVRQFRGGQANAS